MSFDLSIFQGSKASISSTVLAAFPEVKTTIAMIVRVEKSETADVNYMENYTELSSHDEWPDPGREMSNLVDEMRVEKLISSALIVDYLY